MRYFRPSYVVDVSVAILLTSFVQSAAVINDANPVPDVLNINCREQAVAAWNSPLPSSLENVAQATPTSVDSSSASSPSLSLYTLGSILFAGLAVNFII